MKIISIIEEKYLGFLIFLILLKHYFIINNFVLFKKLKYYTQKRLMINRIIRNNNNYNNKYNNNNNNNNTNNKTNNTKKCNLHNRNEKRKDNYKLDDEKGHLSLEFLLISLLAILIFVSISLPLAGTSVDSKFDISDSLTTKSEIAKLANSVNDTYSNGQGSKRTIFIQVPKDTNINFYKNAVDNESLAIVDINTRNGQNKRISTSFKANNLEGNLHLIKNSNNKIIVEWPSELENIVVKVGI